MAKIPPIATPHCADEGEVTAHRARVVTILLKICRSLERMQEPATARRACREVAQRLATMLTEKTSRDPAPR
jgi:hypothetical protein